MFPPLKTGTPLTRQEILQSLWTAEGRSKLKVKPLQGQRWLPTGFMGSRGAGGDEGGVTQDDAKR